MYKIEQKKNFDKRVYFCHKFYIKRNTVFVLNHNKW